MSAGSIELKPQALQVLQWRLETRLVSVLFFYTSVMTFVLSFSSFLTFHWRVVKEGTVIYFGAEISKTEEQEKLPDSEIY